MFVRVKNHVKVEYRKNSDFIIEEYISPEEIDKRDFLLKKVNRKNKPFSRHFGFIR